MPQIDYPELEGKEIDVISENKTIKGIVTGCNYDLGITIQNKDDLNHYILCLNGKSSPVLPEEQIPDSVYKTIFYSHVKKIKNGKITQKYIFDLIATIGYHAGSNPSEATCPFSQ